MAKKIVVKSLATIVAELSTPEYALQDIVGFPLEDTGFLQLAGIGTVGAILDHMDGPDGDKAPVGASMVIGQRQWDRVTDWVIRNAKRFGLPEEFLKEWEVPVPRNSQGPVTQHDTSGHHSTSADHSTGKKNVGKSNQGGIFGFLNQKVSS